MSDAGFLQEQHLLMLTFKWTAYRMNIIIAVLVSELCKLVGTALTSQTGDRIQENMDKYRTDRTLFQGGNERLSNALQ